MLLGIVAALAASAPAVTRAQESTPTPPDTARFNTEVVVTPERGETPRGEVPTATVVLDRKDIANIPVVHPSELVSFMPGFSVLQGQFYAGRPVMSTRGFMGGGEAEYVLLLVDGVPVSDTESGLIDWSLIPASSVRRVEAFRGPGASMYGDAAVGGVIQLLTDRPSNAGSLTLTGGSFNSYTADSSYGRRLGKLGFTFSGAARHTDGAFQHSKSDQFVGGGSLEGANRGLTWRWTGSGEDRKRDDPGSLTIAALEADPTSFDPGYKFDNVDRRAYTTAFVVRDGDVAWHPQARVYVNGRNEDLIRTLPLAVGLYDTKDRTLSSVAVGGSVEGEHAFSGTGSPTVRFGVDLAREHLDTRYNAVSAAGVVGAQLTEDIGARVRAGLFTSASYTPVSRVRLIGSLRWDDIDDGSFATAGTSIPAQTAWSPRGGIVVQLSDKGAVSAFAQASKAFKAPTLDQLFDPRPFPDFHGGTFTISNRLLTPQRATDVEGGLSGGGVVRWSAVVYRTTVDDEINFDLRTFRYVNIGRSSHVGSELELEGAWWKRVRPSVSYAYARVNDRDIPGDLQLSNIPRHVFSAGVSADIAWKVSAFARVYHTGGGYLDDENRYPIDGPSTLDIRVRRPFGRHMLFVDVVNATNNTYAEYGYTLSDFVGRTVPFGYPGAPRAIRAGMTVGF